MNVFKCYIQRKIVQVTVKGQFQYNFLLETLDRLFQTNL